MLAGVAAGVAEGAAPGVAGVPVGREPEVPVAAGVGLAAGVTLILGAT